jgi:hypothetical protein
VRKSGERSCENERKKKERNKRKRGTMRGAKTNIFFLSESIVLVLFIISIMVSL